MPKKTTEQVKDPVTDGGPRAQRSEFTPYTGKESLAPYETILKGKDGSLPMIKYGEPSFSVQRGERKTFKVMAYYASPRGVIRKVWAVLKPTSLRPKDVSILARMRECGVPGAA